MLQWELMGGEWKLTGFVSNTLGTGHSQIPKYFLSQYGPPFKYRMWHRDNKDWVRGTLDHPANIDEAKLCLAAIVRMGVEQ
jgi:hypothetical protein